MNLMPVFVLTVFLFSGIGLSSLTGQEKVPAPVFEPAIQEVQSKTQIPILLPSRLPSVIPEKDIKLARGDLRKDGYFISLYFTEDGIASFAAGFGGSTHILSPEDVPNARRVPLLDGRMGMFRPVSCGGSCAPANLWWEQNGVVYQIQIGFGRTPEERQLKALTEAASAMVPLRKK